jgi:CBS domain-containing protein
MNSALERLVTLRVADAMSRRPTCLWTNQTMSEAAAVLQEHEVSGAPVVDDTGRFVGILSASDFVRYHSSECAAGTGLAGEAGGNEHRLVRGGPSAVCHIEHASGSFVRDYMTSAVQTIPDDAPLLEAARMMTAQHVHRLPVVDRQNRVAGIITSLDLVAAMVKMVDEWRSALRR